MKETREKAIQEIREAAASAAVVVRDAATEAAKVLALATSNSSNTIAVISADIARIKEDIKEVRDFQKNATKEFVNIPDYNEHLRADADHEIRIRGLENSKWLIIGGATVISSVIGIVVTLLSKHLGL